MPQQQLQQLQHPNQLQAIPTTALWKRLVIVLFITGSFASGLAYVVKVREGEVRLKVFHPLWIILFCIRVFTLLFF